MERQALVPTQHTPRCTECGQPANTMADDGGKCLEHTIDDDAGTAGLFTGLRESILIPLDDQPWWKRRNPSAG